MFSGKFENKDDVMREFAIDNTQLKNYEMIFAHYEKTDNVYSDAYVVLKDENGKLFEVMGSHCQCYGLEGQWNPEPTSLAAIKHRQSLFLEKKA